MSEETMSHEVLEYLPVDKIECDPQVRKQVTDESVRGIARSMQEVGLQQPIRVRRDGARYVVVVGERRLRAARLIKLAEIAAIVEQKPLDDGATLQRQLIAALQRDDLSACEKARGIQRLLEVTKRPLAEVAGMLGLSSGTASKLLALNSLPENIRQGVEDGQIPASAAYEISRVSEPEKQAALACRVAEGHLTRDEVVGAVRSELNGNAERTPVALKRVTAPLGNGLSVTVSGEELTLEVVIEALQDYLGRARKARTQGLELKPFIRSLKQAAEA
jgi:ParB family chromosome partitioning protein